MFAYNAVIRSCEKGGQWQQALEFFGIILGEGAQRDTISYNLAISACGKGEQR